MALLLQCLRDLRTMTGDLDLLPPTHGVGRLPRGSGDDAGEASSRPSLATGSRDESTEHAADGQAT